MSEQQQQQIDEEKKMCEWIGNRIQDLGAELLGEALKRNYTLTELYLESAELNNEEGEEDKWDEWTGNEIGDLGVRKMAEGLKHNNSLIKLYLNGDKQQMKTAWKWKSNYFI